MVDNLAQRRRFAGFMLGALGRQFLGIEEIRIGVPEERLWSDSLINPEGTCSVQGGFWGEGWGLDFGQCHARESDRSLVSSTSERRALEYLGRGFLMQV